MLFIAYSILCVFFTCYFPPTFSFVCFWPFSRLVYRLQFSALCVFHVLFSLYSFLCVFMAIFTSFFIFYFFIDYSLLCALKKPFTTYFSPIFSFVCLWPYSRIVYCLQCPFSAETERHCTDTPPSSTCTGPSRSGRLGHRGQCGLLFLCPHRSSRASNHFESVPF